MIKYKEHRGKHSQEAAAAKVGICVSSARRIESQVTLPSQRPPRHWRTRTDPLGSVWDSEVAPMMEAAPALMAITVLRKLQRRHPGEFCRLTAAHLAKACAPMASPERLGARDFLCSGSPAGPTGPVGLHRLR